MRILGRIPHPTLQITVFANDGRFPLQFEQGGLTQIYRFQKSEKLRGLADVQLLVDEDFLTSVLKQFASMRAAHSRAMNTFAPPEASTEQDGLPDII